MSKKDYIQDIIVKLSLMSKSEIIHLYNIIDNKESGNIPWWYNTKTLPIRKYTKEQRLDSKKRLGII